MGWEELYAFAARQQHAIHVGQAAQLGISASTLRKRAQRELWLKPHDGVFLMPGAELTDLARARCVTLAAGSHAAIGRWWALYIHKLIRTPPTLIDVVVPSTKRTPALAGVRAWRSRTLEETDVMIAQGVRTTIPERTLLDLAGVTSLEYLRGRFLAAKQRGLVDERSTRMRIEWMGPFPGRGNIVRILSELEREQPDSSFEFDVRALLRASGLVPYPKPFPFRCPDGVVVHIDVALPEWWVAIECDYIGYHSGPKSFAVDRLRWSQIQLGGWKIVWVSDERLRTDPDGIVREIQEHIGRADPDRPPAEPDA